MRSHGSARIVDVTPGAGARRRSTRGDRDRRRLPGLQPRHRRHHHPRPRRVGHHRRRAGRGARRLRVRDLHGCRRRLHRGSRGWCTRARKIDTHLERRDAGTRGRRRQGPVYSRSGICAPSGRDDPCAVLVQQQRGHPGRQSQGGRQRGRGNHHRPRRRHGRGEDHCRRRARRPGQGRSDLHDRRRDGVEHRHDRAERVRRRDRAHRHLVHPPDVGRREGAAGA